MELKLFVIMGNIADNKPHHSEVKKRKIIFLRPFATILSIIAKVYDKYIKGPVLKSELGACGKHVIFRWNEWHQPWGNVYLSDRTQIVDAKIISHGGKLIVKYGSGAAEGLTVITNFHDRKAGCWFQDTASSGGLDYEKDVIVEEDVWIGANVTIFGGCTIGRGSHIGAGAVIRNNIPPYSVVIGNPAKVIGFSLNPEEIIEHEKVLYPEKERLPITLLEKNYQKLFLNRVADIKCFTKL